MPDEKSMLDELSDMNTVVVDHESLENIQGEEKTTIAPSTDAPIEDKEGGESNGEIVTEIASTEAPTTEVPEVDPIEARLSKFEEENNKLREEIERLSKTKEPTPTQAPTTEIPFQDQDFLGELDLEELTTDPKTLNKLLNSVYQKAVKDTRNNVLEETYKNIPDIVKNNIAIQNNLKKTSENFYAEHEDLKPFKKVVAAVYEELISENPDKKYDELLKNVADEARKRLDLHKKVTNKQSVSKKPEAPKLPRKKNKPGNTQQKPNTNSLADEIDTMNKVLNS